MTRLGGAKKFHLYFFFSLWVHDVIVFVFAVVHAYSIIFFLFISMSESFAFGSLFIMKKYMKFLYTSNIFLFMYYNKTK